MTKTTDMQGRFSGCLLGLALGDAMGAPFEGSLPGGKPLKRLPRTLRYTDDTEMAIGIAESLVHSGGFDPDDMGRRFVENFNPWRGYGPGTVAVLKLIGQGVPWHTANRRVFPEGSYGNGACMRAAPVGIFFHNDAGKLREASYGSSAITHEHPLAKESALLIACSTAEIIKGSPRHELLEDLTDVITLEEYRAKILNIKILLSKDASPEEVIRLLGNSVLAVESAPTALYAFLRHGDDYMETVRFCLSLGGDTDTIAAMAGALSGAFVGEDSLPGELLERLEGWKRLRALALGLHERAEAD